ncbi:MAG TPA: hypothetical protein PKY77_00045 [Phycisphaerae bacterium]|nr:hypothetical protein [Phycisphaerae bacterium]HRY69659.1 hypothetical protein [Phycisphaerae bacterium]HSA29649.1 hypothetical protein [Phycisphaerae bacterium]
MKRDLIDDVCASMFKRKSKPTGTGRGADDARSASSRTLTTRGGGNMPWHPDRKWSLRGREITAEFLSDLTVPDR